MNNTLQNFTYMEHWRKLNRRNMGHTSRSKVGLPSVWLQCSIWRPVHSYSPAEPTGSYYRRGWSTCLWRTSAQTHPLLDTATCTGSSGRRPKTEEPTWNSYTYATFVPELRGRSLICNEYIRRISKQSWNQIWVLDTVPEFLSFFLRVPLL
jgi:hypothetical protein